MSDGVVPTLAELVALRGVAAGPRAMRRVRTQGGGLAPSALRGRGMEYAESREYTAGDDARHIDWRLTARTGRPHTKIFQAERERMTLLVADTATSLYYGTRVRFKSVQAARLGAVVAWAATGEGDRVAVLRGAPREAPVPPAGGVRGALRVLDALARWYAAPPAEDAGLANAIESAQRLLRPGARLVVLADPSSLANIPAHRWSAAARHHEVVLLLLTDPIEMQPPRVAVPLQVGGRRVEVALDRSGVRQQWRAEFAAPVQAALDALPARGVRAMAVSTTDPAEACLPLFLGRMPQVA